MWKPDETKLVKTDIGLIKSGYEDLIFYDFPILFTGKNILGDRILGSFVEFAPDVTTESALHSIIDSSTYARFVNQRISYPEVLKSAKVIFFLNWERPDDPDVYWVNYDEIPEDYRPTAQALYPRQVVLPGFDYDVTLLGGLADNHQAVPETISKVQNKFASFLRKPFELKGFEDLVLNVLLQADSNADAYAPGSLKIKYHVSLEEKHRTLFHDSNEYLEFLDSYITYCLHDLPKDALLFSEPNNSELINFNKLWEGYETLLGDNPGDLEKKKALFIESFIQVAKRLGELSDTVKDDFREMLLMSARDETTHNIGVFDERFSQQINEAVSQIEIRAGTNVSVDDEIMTYVIHIYDLNTDTRNGRALMRHPTDERRLMKPTISISGDAHLTQTQYTESLHLDTIIEVKGRAKKANDLVKHIDIEFEDSSSPTE